MNRFRMWLANFMMGRYGADQLNRFLMIVILVLIVADLFLNWRILYLATIGLLILLYCRMFSRNINARYRENQKFLELTARFRGGRAQGPGGFTGGFGAKTDPAHKILRCPGCGQKLRVPKGAGKIAISCPHCGTKFTHKV